MLGPLFPYRMKNFYLQAFLLGAITLSYTFGGDSYAPGGKAVYGKRRCWR